MTQSFHATLEPGNRRLTLATGDHQHQFAALWLRENAPDEQTRDPQTGQRLIDPAELPLDLNITHLESDANRLELAFSDGHHTIFDIEHLLAQDDAEGDALDDRLLWDSQLDTIPESTFDAAIADDQALGVMLEQLRCFGFVRVQGVPTTMDGMQALIDRIGPLRRTNWGGIADVRSVANAYDLTMTQRGLEPHTDNPYRDPIPGYIWLHCLCNASEGGDSTLVDGYMAARRLAERDPAAYACLTQTPVHFRYRDDSAHLESEGPLIELNFQNQPIRVRYNSRTECVPALAPDHLEQYYAARRAFRELITSEELTVKLKLAEGEMLIMDNYRLFHGRTAYQLAGGERHMRQGYVDRDTTESRRRTLRRRFATQSADEVSA
ncbi:TauD/TfdA family dioxygenase [Salinisphaera sp. SPP-AMP-43]|uniref:2-trimethylaminoethylphosphonate dioxygenase n=1 Tax=Salinisphaera sp. SPP-AMP-43 TaxID=3121288 RepID=UPI003C6DD772